MAHEHLMRPVLRLTSAFTFADLQQLDEAYEAIAEERLAATRMPEVHQEFQAMLELRKLRSRLRKGEGVDTDAVLARWSERRDVWAYPSVLDSLLSGGHATTALRKDAVKLLERDPRIDRFNSWYHLALHLAADMMLADVQQPTVPLLYVEKAVGRWEDVEIAENNVLAYRLLARLHVSKRAEYVRRYGEWLAIIVQRDHLQRLPALAQLGKYFLIFEDYVEHMRDWGLCLSIGESEFVRRRNLPPSARVQAVADWRKAGRTVPAAFRESNGSLLANAEFLLMGTLFFSPPIENDDVYDDERVPLCRL